MKATFFSWQRENWVFTQNNVTNAHNLRQKIHCCLPDPTMCSRTL